MKKFTMPKISRVWQPRSGRSMWNCLMPSVRRPGYPLRLYKGGARAMATVNARPARFVAVAPKR